MSAPLTPGEEVGNTLYNLDSNKPQNRVIGKKMEEEDGRRKGGRERREIKGNAAAPGLGRLEHFLAF